MDQMSDTVMCKKLGRELPALDTPVWPGELGMRIRAEISAEAWAMWKEHAKMLINEYRLNMGTPEGRAFIGEQMQAYLFDSGDLRAVEGYVAPPAVSDSASAASASFPPSDSSPEE